MPTEMVVGITEGDRPLLLPLIKPGGRCKCGAPAVVRYWAEGGARTDKGVLTADTRPYRKFDWPRCGSCPGVRMTQGVWVSAIPMEPHHRSLLKLLGDEDAFVAALRLGWRPDCYGDDGQTLYPFDAENPTLWQVHFDMAVWNAL